MERHKESRGRTQSITSCQREYDRPCVARFTVPQAFRESLFASLDIFLLLGIIDHFFLKPVLRPIKL